MKVGNASADVAITLRQSLAHGHKVMWSAGGVVRVRFTSPEPVAGGLLRTITRLTLNRRTKATHL
jgi:hypothetical protein